MRGITQAPISWRSISQTRAATESYQKAKGLDRVHLADETIKTGGSKLISPKLEMESMPKYPRGLRMAHGVFFPTEERMAYCFDNY